ncbi:MAG: tryptophan synthase subunit alpha, partial [Candidatus Eremiobacteraeota bacterium]|nr:tryptophan synthase subunit alpha [Candidatus Eremiobacteraeota bacterium]
MIADRALDEAFAHARAERRAALIGYVVAGDPDRKTTLAVIDALTAAGVDLIELGIPYGDPLADGPTIAGAAQRA